MTLKPILKFALLMILGSLPAGAQDYDQPYRPQVHFSPLKNWTNDPNGLVYFRGEYHLFFQYNPFGDQWGHMSWGHAVSTDLLHWRELPVAIAEADGVMIFTGSVVIDEDNRSGLCAPQKECMVAVYTGDGDTPAGHRETQNLAYSLDRGRSWTKFKGNPVLDLHLADFRDPSVFWDESRRQWVMAVALPKAHKVQFYRSPDLKQWTLLSDFGPAGDIAGDWECPDLLSIPSTDGKDRIWALKVGLNPGAPQGGSGEQYFLGNFDGRNFTAATEEGGHGWTNHGKDDYCAISFNGLRKGEKPVLLGWMNNWQYAASLPTSPWRGQMSLPRRLAFFRDATGIALKQEPVVIPLRGRSRSLGKPLLAPYEVEVKFASRAQGIFGIRISSDETHWTEIGFDTAQKEFYIDRRQSGKAITAEFPAKTKAPLQAGRPYDLRIVVDRSSVEVYAQEGTIAMTDLIFPLATANTVRVFPEHTIAPVHLWQLHSIWPSP